MDNPGPSDKLQWGPRLWRLLHYMAEVSDRRDIIPLWQKWIHATASIMPCERCRLHLKQYLQTHIVIPLVNPSLIRGADVRIGIRMAMFQLHNDVNIHLGKESIPYEQLEMYSGLSREETLNRIRTLFQELKESWKVESHEWVRIYKNILVRVAIGDE